MNLLRHPGIAFTVCWISLVLPAAAAATADAEDFRFSVAPGKFDEHCLRLAIGEKLRYHFRASAAVDFNIHYHRGKDVFYPVKHAAVVKLDDVFSAPADDDYCLMWENKGEAKVEIDGAARRQVPR